MFHNKQDEKELFTLKQGKTAKEMLQKRCKDRKTIDARASSKKKQEALEKLSHGIIKDGESSWLKDKTLNELPERAAA